MTGTFSPDIADPKRHASEIITRMLAEFRALAVAIFINNQLIFNISTEVFKNTTTKIAFRQVAQEDREILGGAMLFGQNELEGIARLLPGEAYIITEGFYRPRKILTEDLHKKFDLVTDFSSKDLLDNLMDDNWFQKALFKRTAAELSMLKKELDRFNDQRREINVKIAALLCDRLQNKDAKSTHAKVEEKFRQRAKELSMHLESVYELFLDNPFSNYLSPDSIKHVKDPLAIQFWEDLTYQVNNVVEPQVFQSLKILEKCALKRS